MIAETDELAHGRRPAPAGSPVIRLEGVGKSYRNGRREQVVLDDVGLVVSAGEMVAVRGVSGAGKSTLLNLIGGLDRASCGRVEVCGHDLGSLGAAALAELRRRRLGFVFQFYNLLPTLTAGENVRLGLEAAGEPPRRALPRALAALDAVGLATLADAFPEELSGGEQQRVAIARALAREPALLLADEPTGNLDEASRETVLELLAALPVRLGTAVVVATHDPRVAARAGRTLELVSGRLLAPAT